MFAKPEGATLFAAAWPLLLTARITVMSWPTPTAEGTAAMAAESRAGDCIDTLALVAWPL